MDNTFLGMPEYVFLGLVLAIFFVCILIAMRSHMRLHRLNRRLIESQQKRIEAQQGLIDALRGKELTP